MQKILLITPPFTQLNTPYPATAYLKGFLNTQNIPAFHCDLGIEVILELFSSHGFSALFRAVEDQDFEFSENTQRIVHLQKDYLKTIDHVIDFLQNNNPNLAYLICGGDYIPEASRFAQVDDLDWAFGTMATTEKARHLATLYLEDISDLIIEAVDSNFGFSRYAERLGRSASSFDDLHEELQLENGIIDQLLIHLLEEKIETQKPTLVALSVPFPGNLYAAFKCAQYLKEYHPNIVVTMGGGFPNTELRSVTDTRVFDYVDYITLDDGETPILNLIQHLNGERSQEDLKRTFAMKDGQVHYFNGSQDNDFPQKDVGTPDYSDLVLDKYLSVIEIANPMHRLWSDGRWNKLTLAHGCYWSKCTFCDVSLDYINRYEPLTAKLLCDKIEEIIKQTEQSGFHFVDEAAPPVLMRELALEILRRNLTIVWWTNIRFDKTFTADLCRLLKASGCIAISGGLEVASDRLLKLINKGVTVSQVARVCNNFTNAGIMVHTYLMYGFPTQSSQETIDSLEMVRQLFEQDVVQSGFWHQFAMTAHSPIGIDPTAFKVQPETSEVGTFSNNDIMHVDPTGADHKIFSEGLRKSLFNYMHGVCLDWSLNEWFEFDVPRTTITPNFIELAIASTENATPKPNNKVVWLGTQPTNKTYLKKKNGKEVEMLALTFITKKEKVVINVKADLGQWIAEMLPSLSASNETTTTFGALSEHFEQQGFTEFETWWEGYTAALLQTSGLLVL
jgi:hypothetical protein